MNTVEQNSQVRAWFSQFDRDAVRLGTQRARNLREELHAHLLDALPPAPSEADVSRVLSEMGDPSAIVSQEAESAALAGHVRPSIAPIVVPAAVALGLVVALLIGAPAVLTLPGPLAVVVLLILVGAVAFFAALAISRSISRRRSPA